MHIADLLHNRKRPLLSFEFFPPKDEQGLDTLKRAAEALRVAQPDFVTVTYGAGGSTRLRTFEVCDLLRGMGFDPVMPHLTCVGSSRAELGEVADEIHSRGYRNVMVLRGDPPKGETVFRPAPDGLAHASDLVALLKKRHADFCCGVAGYPEKHPEAASLDADLGHLTEKIAAGGSFVTTQLFFTNSFYFDFVRRCRNFGVLAPILPGIMPALSHKQIQRFTSTCGARVPPELERALRNVGDDADASAAVGIEWAVQQIEDLLANGAPGIHLYVLNRSRIALAPAVLECFARYRRG
jgi:methylenetetrahydrofolate reductase (NADPH)